MKKSLLVIAAAMIVALGANAQKVMTSHKMATPTGVTLQKATKAMNSEMSVRSMKKAAKASAKSIEGEYILNSNNWDGDFTASSMFTIVPAEGKITLLPAEEGETPEEFTYNVALNGFANLEGSNVYGYYNAEEGYIRVPQQVAGKSETYGDIVFSACITADGAPQTFGFDMYLIINEDGSIDIDEGDFSEYIEAGLLPAGAAITGYYNYLPSITEGGNGWNYGFDCEIYIPNATLYFATTGKYLGSSTGEWENVTKRVYVEDWGTELVINNFLGLAPVSVTLNGDGTCFIPLPQFVDDYDYTNDDFAYGCMRLVGCSLQESSISRDYTKTALNGFVTEEGMEFFKTEYREAWTDTEGGEHEAGDYFIDDDPNYIRYFAVATAADNNQAAYGMGWCCNLALQYDNETGIKNVKTAQATSNKIYNMMGQEVKSMGKGMFISNGKKFIKK